jgi:hypothetical protein
MGVFIVMYVDYEGLDIEAVVSTLDIAKTYSGGANYIEEWEVDGARKCVGTWEFRRNPDEWRKTQ